MSTLKNSDPQLIRDTIDITTGLLSSYGWSIFGLILIIAIVWKKFLSKHFYKWRERREILNTGFNNSLIIHLFNDWFVLKIPKLLPRVWNKWKSRDADNKNFIIKKLKN